MLLNCKLINENQFYFVYSDLDPKAASFSRLCVVVGPLLKADILWPRVFFHPCCLWTLKPLFYLTPGALYINCKLDGSLYRFIIQIIYSIIFDLGHLLYITSALQWSRRAWLCVLSLMHWLEAAWDCMRAREHVSNACMHACKNSNIGDVHVWLIRPISTAKTRNMWWKCVSSWESNGAFHLSRMSEPGMKSHLCWPRSVTSW